MVKEDNNTPSLAHIPYSVLDLATVLEGKTPADTFRDSLKLAQHVEELGYHRFWLAEHHNMISVASSATSVVIGHIAAGTKKIRVGSGGIMLPNHSPLVIAEQFGTLASLFPGRIDLGLGRAPGTDQLTANAIRPDRFTAVQNFPNEIRKLQTYFSAENSLNPVRAIPGEGLDIPIWVLGSSTDSARLAAEMGLPYAFASHFAPAQFLTAIHLYRQNFKPSIYLEKPYVISCINVVAADTDQEAAFLATSLLLMFKGVITGRPRLLPPPVDHIEALLTEYEQDTISQMLSCSFVGGPQKIKTEIAEFMDQTKVDELMVTSNIFDLKAKLHAFQLFADLMRNK